MRNVECGMKSEKWQIGLHEFLTSYHPAVVWYADDDCRLTSVRYALYACYTYHAPPISLHLPIT